MKKVMTMLAFAGVALLSMTAQARYSSEILKPGTYEINCAPSNDPDVSMIVKGIFKIGKTRPGGTRYEISARADAQAKLAIQIEDFSGKNIFDYTENLSGEYQVDIDSTEDNEENTVVLESKSIKLHIAIYEEGAKVWGFYKGQQPESANCTLK